MPARVHALVVVRPEPGAPSDLHLRRALDALAAQTVAPTAVTIVLCGADAATALLARESGHADVVTRPAHTGIAAAAHDVAPNSGADAVWVLTQSAVPDPDALERLVAALETSEAVAIAAPKLVRWEDPRRMVSFGQTMTRFDAPSPSLPVSSIRDSMTAVRMRCRPTCGVPWSARTRGARCAATRVNRCGRRSRPWGSSAAGCAPRGSRRVRPGRARRNGAR